MANLDLASTQGSRISDTTARSASASTKHKLQTVLHVALFSAAFIFVAALVCGVLV